MATPNAAWLALKSDSATPTAFGQGSYRGASGSIDEKSAMIDVISEKDRRINLWHIIQRAVERTWTRAIVRSRNLWRRSGDLNRSSTERGTALDEVLDLLDALGREYDHTSGWSVDHLKSLTGVNVIAPSSISLLRKIMPPKRFLGIVPLDVEIGEAALLALSR
jgi:hypothetical protein